MLLEIGLLSSLQRMIVWFEIGSWSSFGIGRILWHLGIKVHCFNLATVYFGHLVSCPTLSIKWSVIIWGVPHIVEAITCKIHTLYFSGCSDVCRLSVGKSTLSSTISPGHMDIKDLLSCSFPLFGCLSVDTHSVLWIDFGNWFSNPI